jgi:uncharacterized phiE125 gp8 family phage protein
MAITIVTPPAALPVTVEECKAYGRIDFDDADALIESLIGAARDHLEQATGRTFVATTYQLTLDAFPCDEIALPRSPVLSVASVKYYDRRLASDFGAARLSDRHCQRARPDSPGLQHQMADHPAHH